MKRLPIRTTVIPDVIPTVILNLIQNLIPDVILNLIQNLIPDVILNLIQNLPTKIAGQARNDDYPGSPLNLTRTKTRI